MAEKKIGLSLELLSHPGETLLEVLESNNMTQKELAARIDISPKHLNQIISGLASISSETAYKLEKVFSLSATFWNNLQSKYDREKMQILEENEITKEERDIFCSETYAEIVKLGYLERETKIERKIIQLREFLGVSNLINVSKMLQANAVFRKSTKVTSNPFAMAAWMKICEIETNDIVVEQSIDIDKLKNKLDDMKKLNCCKDISSSVSKLKNMFSECGIAFSVVHNIKGAPVQGFIRKINNKMRLCITLRNQYADIFWFTLFHEIGHLLDEKNELFVDYSNKDLSKSEQYADNFASNFLIDCKNYQEFVTRNVNSITNNKIVEFAHQEGVLPGILVGRLQHDKHIPNSFFNDLRTKYVWG